MLKTTGLYIRLVRSVVHVLDKASNFTYITCFIRRHVVFLYLFYSHHITINIQRLAKKTCIIAPHATRHIDYILNACVNRWLSQIRDDDNLLNLGRM